MSGSYDDVLPWYAAGETLFVLARRAYPRPILGCDTGESAPLDGARPVTYITEPANVQQRDKPLAQTVEEVLARFPSLGADRLRRLEAVLPRHLSTNTVATALLCRAEGEVWLGADDDDLPAAQCFDGHSDLLVAPAWRLPRDVRGLDASRAWVAERVRAEYGAAAGGIFELGGRYHPSPGVTPRSSTRSPSR